MVKTIVITLNEDVPDTELGQDAQITVGANNYTGKVKAILTHEASIPSTVTLEGQGLKVATA